MNILLRPFRPLISPRSFYTISARWSPRLGWLTLCLFAVGLVWALRFAPADYQQGESYRIIFIHVPAAWMSLSAFALMAVCGISVLIWKMKVAEVVAAAIAPVGAAFTLLALATGSLWGKPMWGAWWVWDARLTSELVLLFLYLGWMALDRAIENPRTAARACAVLALVGLVDLPIIKYSVEWWTTLHQGSTIKVVGENAIHPSMLWPLLTMVLACHTYVAAIVLQRARVEWMEREQGQSWVAEVLQAGPPAGRAPLGGAEVRAP